MKFTYRLGGRLWDNLWNRLWFKIGTLLLGALTGRLRSESSDKLRVVRLEDV